MSFVQLPYLRILDGDAEAFGGNQSRDAKRTVREGACGPVAATGLVCYLEGRSRMERADFMKRMNRLRRSFFPMVPYLGSNAVILALGLNLYFITHRMHYRAFWALSRKKQFTRMEEMLRRDVPVILCIGNNLPRFWRKGKLTLYRRNSDGTMSVHTRTNAHFVTVTELGDEWMGVSSWGKKLYVRRSEWEDYVKNYSCAAPSNIVYVKKTR